MKTPFSPVSPYGAAKLYAYHSLKFIKMHMICIYVMEFYLIMSQKDEEKILSHKKLFCLQNNTMIAKGFLKVGNLNSKRDWGDAEDYIYAMWLMLQQKTKKLYSRYK